MERPLKTKSKIIVTGASGFIGQRLLAHCKSWNIRAVSLRNTEVEDIDLEGVETIIHLAGIAHRMNEPSGQIYYDVNTNLTKEFAKKAKKTGVKHFVFMSTIKVYGVELTESPLTLGDHCAPNDDYGKSKWYAEQALQELASDNFKVAIIRPVLVYGAGVKGNLLKLMSVLQKGTPLPLKGIQNTRSLIFVGTLVALIEQIVDQQANGVFLAADTLPLSTSDLIYKVAEGLGVAINWFSIPSPIRSIIKLIRPRTYIRLFESLEVDPTDSYSETGFSSPFTQEEGIKEMTNWYQINQK